MQTYAQASRPAAEPARQMQAAPSPLGARLNETARAVQLRSLAAQLNPAPRRNETGLPDALKTGIETLSGVSMDGVKLHYNSPQPAQLNAHAYAQGSDIHVAPGQERHVPHEAWHVVQQAQGRVRPTMQMAAVAAHVAVNDDPLLEQEADTMGALALQGHGPVQPVQRVTGGNGTVQRQNAAQAGGIVTGFAAGADAGLYNIPVATNVQQGIVYSIVLPQAPDVGAVINAYILQARAIGDALTGREFLDKNAQPPQPPNAGNWGAGGAAYLAMLEGFTASPPGTFGALNRAAAVTLSTRLMRANRLQNRNDAAIGLIDPFIARITIPRAGHNAWVIDTNFSHNAKGYITRITAGSVNFTGVIRDAGGFAAVAATAPGAGGQAEYSSSHDIADNNDVGTQIGTIDPAATNAANHVGFDAVAKLGAEGARYEPVRQLGTALSIQSKFFIFDAAGAAAKAVTFIVLYQRWGAWFNSEYNIDAATIAAEVLARAPGVGPNPVNIAGPVDMVHDYDLDRGMPASQTAAAVTAAITALLPPAADPQNSLPRYQMMYPALYAAAQPPPPVVVAPVQAPVVVAPVLPQGLPPPPVPVQGGQNANP